MKVRNQLLLYILLACVAVSCRKDNGNPDELSKLPPATQEGKNTFGCLVNGKAWIAQTDCKILCDPAFTLYYDGSSGGYIGIGADWKNSSQQIDTRIDIVFDSSDFKTTHDLSITNPLTIARYINYSRSDNCGNYEHFTDPSVTYEGMVKITRYDLTEGIISGTFEFTLSKPGCETITVTDGRFDKQL